MEQKSNEENIKDISSHSKSISNNEEEIRQKMKENFKLLFIQLKSGCQRAMCYNPYCAKYFNGVSNILS
jgi:hypothetical protein